MADDTLTLTIRLHDPAEKQDATKSACWSTQKVQRSDLTMPADQFAAKYIIPAIKTLKNLKVT